jgi:2-polyprenyl-3-methyl-5-hydroxy-6-metoxy-1,4-benzoquinol methylase
MNKLNLKYYKENKKYSDGNIENEIINYLKNNDDYLEILKKNNSWPVYYHLSKIRENIINWYPFKKDGTVLEVGAGMGAITSILCEKLKNVTCIESSKTRATAILERTKKYNNIDIIVGEFSDIELKNKFDYILLNGVFEYAGMFNKDTDVDPYKEFLKNIKKYLNKNGKILIAIENRFGLKYWLGADEDHTNYIYGGINNYKNTTFFKTFSKNDLINMFSELDLYANFYYPLPDYKFPEYIVTDQYVEKNKSLSYTPYYQKTYNLFANEKELFGDIIKNNALGFMANSYFIELSSEPCDIEIEFVKSNNTRVDKYCTQTYKKGDRYYKKALSDKSQEHIDNIFKYNKLLNDYGVKTLEMNKSGNEIFTNSFDANSFDNYLANFYINKEYKKMYKAINDYIKYLKKIFKKVNINNVETIYDNYRVIISDDLKNKLYFIKDGYLDFIFQNILMDGNDYIIIDQEWYESYVPLEFIVYRAINMFAKGTLYNLGFTNSNEIFNMIIENINIDFIDIESFKKLEEKFLEKVFGENIENKCYGNFVTFKNRENDLDGMIKNYDSIKNENIRLNDKISDLELLLDKNREENSILNNQIAEYKNENKRLNVELDNYHNAYNSILNSKTWKLKTKIDKVLKR